jgi:hypothetical protein
VKVGAGRWDPVTLKMWSTIHVVVCRIVADQVKRYVFAQQAIMSDRYISDLAKLIV